MLEKGDKVFNTDTNETYIFVAYPSPLEGQDRVYVTKDGRYIFDVDRNKIKAC